VPSLHQTAAHANLIAEVRGSLLYPETLVTLLDLLRSRRRDRLTDEQEVDALLWSCRTASIGSGLASAESVARVVAVILGPDAGDRCREAAHFGGRSRTCGAVGDRASRTSPVSRACSRQ
jgi:hypothetical protein